MEQNKRTRVAILIALIVLLAIFGSFSYSIYSARTAGVSLPSLEADTSVDPPENSHSQRVEVTADTVQAVIASLHREESYYRTLTVQTNWDGGSSVSSAQTWVDSGYTYTRAILPSGSVRYSLSDGSTLYYWYAGSSTYLTAPDNSLNADLAQRIPTYEDILALPADRIQNAGYGSYGEHPCIYAETGVDELGYLERYWVSVSSGLLVAAETVKDEQVVLSVNATYPITTPCPPNVKFALPDGTVLHSF
ncbi:MAG: hypothetical protein IJB75_04225 [Oscillospiraceae bacterium]|nr:hypothetical protein [Oscillospiraceae bacterium]